MALVIFDYDGVLADTLDDLIVFGQEAVDRLGVKHRVSKEDLNGLESTSFVTFGLACEVPEQQVDEFVRVCVGLIAQKGEPSDIFPGMRDVVRQLSAAHKIAVVTTNTAQIVSAFLAKHGLDDVVDAAYTLDLPGTKAQKIARARDELLGKDSRAPVYMIGDALSDVRAAREAGAISVAVLWGHQSLEVLQRANPDHVANTPQELIGIIGP